MNTLEVERYQLVTVLCASVLLCRCHKGFFPTFTLSPPVTCGSGACPPVGSVM